MLYKSFVATVLAASAVSAAPIHHSGFKVPSVEEAAAEVRTLVNRESLANLATIDATKDSNVPVSFMEYYADCDDDGTLTLLSLNIGTSYRNIANGSPASLSIRVGDHAMNERVDPHYPGGIVDSPAGSPRVSLSGTFVDVDDDIETHERLTKCFIKRHPDAKWWLPGNHIHTSRWTQFKVDGVYFLGGFGDRAYIGDIPVELYRDAKPSMEAFTMNGKKGCSGSKKSFHHKQSDASPVISTFWNRFLSLFTSVEEQLPNVTEESHHKEHHSATDFHHGSSEHVLNMQHGNGASELSEEEIFAIHHKGMTREEVSDKPTLSVRDDKPVVNQAPFLTPKRLSNAEAGRKMRAILEAQKAGLQI